MQNNKYVVFFLKDANNDDASIIGQLSIRNVFNIVNQANQFAKPFRGYVLGFDQFQLKGYLDLNRIL